MLHCQPQIATLKACLSGLTTPTPSTSAPGPATALTGHPCMGGIIEWKTCCEDAKVRKRDAHKGH